MPIAQSEKVVHSKSGLVSRSQIDHVMCTSDDFLHWHWEISSEHLPESWLQGNVVGKKHLLRWGNKSFVRYQLSFKLTN